MYSRQDINAQVTRGLAQEERLMGLQPRFDEAAVRAPGIPVILDADMHTAVKRQQDGITTSLRAERASILLKEADLALGIVGECLKRLHILLRERKPVYPDSDIDRCIKDINIHTEQTDTYLERLKGYFEVIGGEVISDVQKKQLEDAGKLAKLHHYDFGKIQDWMDVIAAAPVSQKKEDDYFAYTDPLPEDIRQAFLDNNMTLGLQFMEYRDLTIDRIENSLKLLEQIDTRLLPLKLDDAEMLFDARQSLGEELQANAQNIESYARYVNAYLNHALAYFPQPDPS